MPYKNIEDRRAASRRHYERNTQQMKDRAVAFKREQRRKVDELLKATKEAAPCADCGVNYPYYVMQFDHVRGEKLFNLADTRRNDWVGIKKVQEEIDKCEIVCANCHAIRTHERGQRYGKRPGDDDLRASQE